MFHVIYIEQDLLGTEKADKILSKFRKATVIKIEKYTEIFNRRNQNFRFSKNAPSLIIAKKNGKKVHPTPPSFHIGTERNFYFSHMLNCPYDCRYCFLQAMYSSAHQIIFVNKEDFFSEIEQEIYRNSIPATFFTGYDADSLALDAITDFIEDYYPLFLKHRTALFELRTKSTNIHSLLKKKPLENVIVAFTLSPKEVANKIELKAPSLEARLTAIQKLQEHGWRIGLRFDPVIECRGGDLLYCNFFREVNSSIQMEMVHSITLGKYRLPHSFQKKMFQMHPTDPLIHSSQKNCGSFDSLLKEIRLKNLNDKVYICD